MRTSDTINELATALSAAQGEMKAAPMTGRNPHLKNKYATLNDIIDTARPVLAKHALAYVQMPTSPDNPEIPMIGLTTRLMHKSGEWVESDIFFPVDPGSNRAVNPAQVAGSTITYMRRYALSAMLGIVADEDADGEQPLAQTKPAPTKAAPVKSSLPPDDALLYGDGSFVANDPRTAAVYHAYVEAHNGKAPDTRFNLSAWHKKQQNGNAPAAKPAAKPADYYEGMKELNVITGEPEKLFDVPPTGPGAFSEE